jgi:vacuolar iron transporter family protein
MRYESFNNPHHRRSEGTFPVNPPPQVDHLSVDPGPQDTKVIDMTENQPQDIHEIGDTHTNVSGGWLRAAVFGAMDGLVTNIALVSGVGGSGASSKLILLSGMAGLAAGAFSMALGEYVSVETQNDAVQAEAVVERRKQQRNPEAEQAELVGMYVDMGLTQETAERMAAEIHADPDLALKVHMSQEFSVDLDAQPSPWTAAISSFLCFATGALIPLLSYLFGFSSLLIALGVGGVGLFVVGALVTKFTTRPWWFNGLRQLAFGALAAGATYLVGSLIGVSSAG